MQSIESGLTIGALAQRAGVATSAVRFYEAQGLLRGSRTEGNQRRYAKETLRRVAFIRIAQGVGLSLDEVRAALATLPEQRTPTPADWARLSRAWKPLIEARIAALAALRDQLDSCIGCGCLSLKTCKLYNPADSAARLGSGPRYLLGDRPPRPNTSSKAGA
ncbi:redox-sensitive transcriptional activator SoxR [Rhizobacter sp. AJA081-3]|jgi:MerR family redox-sensitive transcriptional activator SoxR|uniref:redox-sensitive transcriptional activator SoxR n=1 Tax=Rhizobacter sp. AJA081-3 TaxID=2753607 RepID=UPI001AE06CA9|nr:redox-sensitive transcriptional activator SoxR [Rhizobacter sp. AJA081-3]QTN21941.1 redox-sensitive transcriptional activator SoxR [Rhizobacter sp. AJA081-3]